MRQQEPSGIGTRLITYRQLQWAPETALPLKTHTPTEESPYHLFEFWKIDVDTQEGQACSGTVGPGFLWIEYVEGSTDSGDWFISEVLGAAYENKYALTTMNYIFVNNVINIETREFNLTHLLIERNGLCKPPQSPLSEKKVSVWRRSSAGFRALLGTPIGRIVAGLVLCAYGQGVRRIASIAVFWTGVMEPCLKMRFDLEGIQK